MKVAICGVTGLRNRGVDALLTSTIAGIRALAPGCEIAVVTADPGHDASRLDNLGATTYAETPVPTRSRRLLRRFGIRTREPASMRGALEGANLLLVSGGDLFGSDYGSFDRWLETPRHAMARDIPVVFLGQSVGPFRTRGEGEAWCKVARRASLISVRESLSRDYVVGQLGIPADRVQVGADQAFALEPAVLAQHQPFVAGENRPLAVVAPSHGISHYTASNEGQHVRALVRCVRVLLDECGANVMLIPHVEERDRWNDDRVLATELLGALGHDPRVRVTDAGQWADELKARIGQGDLLLSERMHASIAGMAMAVPTLTVGYSVKARGIHAEVYGAGAEYGESLIALDTFLDGENAAQALRALWKARDRHKVLLESQQDRLRASARAALAAALEQARTWT